MSRLKLLAAVAENLAPLIVFIVLNRLAGLRIAIVGAIAIAVLDAARRYVFGVPYNRLIAVATAMTIGFGLIDLFAATPFMLRYEAALSSFIVACAFAFSTRGHTSLIETLDREQGGTTDRPDLRRFFAILTLIWAGYFLLSALFYLYLALTLPIDRAATVRAIWLVASLGVMAAATALLGRSLFRLLKRRGLLP